VTRETRSVSPTSGCPDPALIAAHADHRLSGAEAARMDEHVAGCRDCYQVFAETVRFGLAEDEAGVARAGAPVAAPALFRRPLFKTAAALATAAVVLLALALWFTRGRLRGAPAPLLAELAEAMGDRRFVQPRLTGGFRHGRLVTLRSGDTREGLDTQSPAVLGAVARIRQRAEGDTSPEALGALGVTYLVSGDTSAAVKALESATAQDPKDARLQSDLAAAYLVRAERADEPADIPKALEAAERAIALENAPVEAWFNRALALERLHLTDAARKAWDDYLQRDTSSPWAEEARQHLEALPKEQKSSAEEDKARVRAALDEGPAATDRLADEAPHLLREYFDDELLPAWAEAHLAGDPQANLHAEHARLLGDALLRSTGDAMAQDTARALAEPPATATSRDALRSQALGYGALREAKGLYDAQQSSCAASRAAQRELGAGGSPYVGWGRLQVVISCLHPSKPQAAHDALALLENGAAPRSYLQLLGRVRWLQGLTRGVRADLTESLDLYRSALATFRKARDLESQAAIHVWLAESLHLMGDLKGAWRERSQSHSLLHDVQASRRRHAILAEAVSACLDERKPRTALHFQTALVDSAFDWSRAAAIREALTQRAGIHDALGRERLAEADLQASRNWVARIADAGLARDGAADSDAAEGTILLHRQPKAAAAALERALTYFRSATPARVPGLQLLLARAQMAQGLDAAAERELLTGIEAFEQQRTTLRDAALQVSFFDQSFPMFDDMVRLQVLRRHDPERALAFVERGRARQLMDALADTTFTPLEPAAMKRELPDGLALVYYAVLDDRLFAWVLTRSGSRFLERPLPAAELSRLVAAHRASLDPPVPVAAVRLASSRLHDELVRPLLPFLASQRALIFIPDGVLQSVAFASLWDRQTSRYLAEDYLLGLAPSGTVFIHASAGTGAALKGRTSRALIVGNPLFNRQLWALPSLPAAEAEAGAISGLYAHATLLTGSGATKAAFLAAARTSDVVHYAGHASADTDAPSAARLLFAPDARGNHSGALYLHELRKQDFRRARVVVLAACRTAAGAVSRVEGALSLCRPFLAAGVPNVVASLWDIDDAVSRRFFTAFHRGLLDAGDPLVALRRTQVAFLHDGDPSLAHPASWAAFICMGGLDPHSFTKGELS
jgi:CHAT domain-containing protein/tetratricopeptide (TPR) repeat protein